MSIRSASPRDSIIEETRQQRNIFAVSTRPHVDKTLARPSFIYRRGAPRRRVEAKSSFTAVSDRAGALRRARIGRGGVGRGALKGIQPKGGSKGG